MLIFKIGFIIPIFFITRSICKLLNNNDIKQSLSETKTLLYNMQILVNTITQSTISLNVILNEDIPTVLNNINRITEDIPKVLNNINKITEDIPDALTEIVILTKNATVLSTNFNKTNKNVNEFVESIEFKPLRRSTKTFFKKAFKIFN